MKRMREPSEKSNKEKQAKLGESSGSRPLIPLVGSPGKSVPLPRFLKIKPIASSLPQTTPIYTSSETTPSTTRSSKPPSLKFNLATTTLPVSKAEMLNETTSPSSSPSPQSPPYYELFYNIEPSDPQSPTMGLLQARALASQQPSHPEPEQDVTSSPPEHPNPTTCEPPQTPPEQQPTHSEPQPTPQPELSSKTHSDIPLPITSADPTTPTLNLTTPNSPSPASATEP
ncbi:lysine-rich arabinogalactan protein 19-like [Lathyrus oleraceus]|uniref:lysine-rich arabinogalactan protein 19-like n=1 Tax=Pisum sativum TaxID=3888 RepID=UPI0021D18B88|nr:lysine-rich arabinogalactan protein 19-like [Pisum sativum]